MLCYFFPKAISVIQCSTTSLDRSAHGFGVLSIGTVFFGGGRSRSRLVWKNHYVTEVADVPQADYVALRISQRTRKMFNSLVPVDEVEIKE